MKKPPKKLLSSECFCQIRIDSPHLELMILLFCDHSDANHPKPHTLTFLHRLQLIHFLIVFIFTWVPPDPGAAVVVVIRLLWQEGRVREWRHTTFHPELMCQAYHTAERSWGDILHWISDISRTVQIYPSLSSIRLDFSIPRVSILITQKRMSEDFLFSAP